jgi:hypothetical protein
MKKFTTPHDFDNHYRFCAEHQIPYISIKSGRKYAYLQFDVYEMVKPQGLLDEQPGDFIMELYQNYARFFALPKHKFSFAGGSNNAGFTVFNEHAEFLAASLYDYLLRIVREQQKKKPQTN